MKNFVMIAVLALFVGSTALAMNPDPPNEKAKVTLTVDQSAVDAVQVAVVGFQSTTAPEVSVSVLDKSIKAERMANAEQDVIFQTVATGSAGGNPYKRTCS